MAIFRPGAMISEIRGSIGDVTYSRNRQGPYAKAKLIQTNPNTEYQQAVRAFVTEGNAAWKLITDDQFQAWADYVQQHPNPGRLPGATRQSAYNEFVSRYIFRGMVESAAVNFNPFPPVRKSPWIESVISSETELTVFFNSLGTTTNTTLLIYASIPVSSSVRFINPSLYKFITAVDGNPESGSVEFLTEYLARMDTTPPTAGNRIGVCIRAINSDNFACSEKSYANVIFESYVPPLGTAWTLRTTPGNHIWAYLAASPSLIVATSASEDENEVMTSTDGITWTIQDTPGLGWYGIAYGSGIFVAVDEVAITLNAVMTSPDGETWTRYAVPANRSWANVAFGAGLFVAVGRAGTTSDVMTSTDGETWTLRTTPNNGNWTGITYGAGLFVAVSVNGTTSSVMTSPDGETWTLRTAASNASWRAVAYGAGLFVAVAFSGSGDRIMTSPDGINWTLRTPEANLTFYGIAYGNGVWIATASSGTGQRAVRSTDGVTWSLVNTAADQNWRSVIYAAGKFIAVSTNGSGNQVMTAP